MLTSLRSFSRRHGLLAGILCCLLLCMGATLQVAHTHQAHEDHAGCALCVTAHAAVELVILPTGFVGPLSPIERATRRAEHAPIRVALAHPLWNRPPPASLPLA